MNRHLLNQTVETALAALQSTGRELKLLYSKGLLYFVFEDDWPVRNAAADRIFTSFDEVSACAKERDIAMPGSLGYQSGIDFRMISALLKKHPGAAILDVGANYGREAIRYALFRRCLGLAAESDRPAIIALEPCPVRHVAAVNFDLHNAPEIRILPCAAGAERKYANITFRPDNTLGGSLVMEGGDRASLLVQVRPLDDVLSELNIDQPVFMKVDTQGVEAQVMEGVREYLKDHPVISIIEFAPRLLCRATDVADFLNSLVQQFHVFDLGWQRKGLTKVDSQSVTGFINGLNAVGEHTDLLLIDRRLDGVTP